MLEQDGNERATQEFPLEDGCTVLTATRTDPYGFWYIKVNQGTLPEKYTGAYTSSYEVKKAVTEYKNILKKKEEDYIATIKEKNNKPKVLI